MSCRDTLISKEIPFMVINSNDVFEIIDFIIKEIDLNSSKNCDNIVTIIKIKHENYEKEFASYAEFLSFVWINLRHKELNFLDITIEKHANNGEIEIVASVVLGYEFSFFIISSSTTYIFRNFDHIERFLKTKARKFNWGFKNRGFVSGLCGMVSLASLCFMPTTINIIVNLIITPLLLGNFILVIIGFLKDDGLKLNRIKFNF